MKRIQFKKDDVNPYRAGDGTHYAFDLTTFEVDMDDAHADEAIRKGAVEVPGANGMMSGDATIAALEKAAGDAAAALQAAKDKAAKDAEIKAEEDAAAKKAEAEREAHQGA